MGTRTGVLVALVLGLFVASGCRPLYGDRPEKLRTPDKKKKPDDPPDPTVEVKYVEDCNTNFRDDPKLAPKPNPTLANTLVGDGDIAMDQSTKAKDAASQVNLLTVAIDKYRNALIKDAYNHEATFKLAVAYDAVYRKGCALALLKRLQSMAANPKFAKQANRIADEINDKQNLFKGYRKDALAAVGR